jgi:hypothetical protein
MADGVSVGDRVTGGAATNFSQESVQEFQITTANFDVSTGVTSVGAVNIVTRGGTNNFHGAAFYFYRDHNLSAFPSLKRPTDPSAFNAGCEDPTSATCKRLQDPFFGRDQMGFNIGGPIKKDKAFFFTNYEYLDLTNVIEVAFDQTLGERQAQLLPAIHRGAQHE